MKRSDWKVLASIPFIFILQIEYYFHLNQFPVILALLFPVLLTRRHDYKFNKTVVYSISLSLLFIFMLVEPAIAYGKIHLDLYFTDLWMNIVYSLLFSALLVTMIYGVILKALWRKPVFALSISSIVYVLSVTPVQLFLSISGLPELLLFNIAFLVVFSFFMGFMYLKSNFNLLSPMLFLLIYSIFLAMNVNVQVSKLFNLVWEVISLSVLLFITDRLMKESINIKRVLKSRRVAFKKKDNTTPVIFAGILIILILLVLMPIITQESHYVIADPTDSMYPQIQPGSLLFVKHIDVNQVRAGEVIVFNAPWENGTLFAHEVINITYSNGHEFFVTKGINNPAKDPLPVPSRDLVGQVYFTLPYVGYVLIYSQLTAVFIIAVIGVFYFREARMK